MNAYFSQDQLYGKRLLIFLRIETGYLLSKKKVKQRKHENENKLTIANK